MAALAAGEHSAEGTIDCHGGNEDIAQKNQLRRKIKLPKFGRQGTGHSTIS